jgi:DNA-binding CsgD family transcriptional regulator
MWDDEALYVIQVRQLRRARDVGALGQLSLDLNSMASLATWCGDFATASSLIAEVDAVTEATGSCIPLFGAVTLAAYEGHHREASELIEATIAETTAAGLGSWAQMARWLGAVLFNGLGRYDAALTLAQKASEDTPELYLAAWALPELIEAAARSGAATLAREALQQLAETTTAAQTDWALGIQARSRALLSDGEAAERLYREATERLGRTRLRPELARAHLVYGEWLRRERREADARVELRIAQEMFAGIGMTAFTRRAVQELRAAGVRPRSRPIQPETQLTAREAQVARMAGDGFTNSEIASRLFISSRTVQYHLSKVFVKLGIRSRTQLAQLLPSSDGTPSNGSVA